MKIQLSRYPDYIFRSMTAGKCKEMNKIKQALRLYLDGESNWSIGRKRDLYKGTADFSDERVYDCSPKSRSVIAAEKVVFPLEQAGG